MIQEWAIEYEASHPGDTLTKAIPLSLELHKTVLDALNADAPIYYHETQNQFVHIRTVSLGYIDSFISDPKFASAPNPNIPSEVAPTRGEGVFELSHAQQTVEWLDGLHAILAKPKKKKDTNRIDEAKRALRSYILKFEEDQGVYDVQVAANFAGTAVALKSVPAKLNPLIRGVMNGVKVRQ